MEVKSVFESWDRCGLKSMNSFTLSNHYSMLFDDSDDGFDYMFNVFGLSRNDLINSTNPKVNEIINQIDGEMIHITNLIEDFIKTNLFNDREIEEVENSVRELRDDISDTYSDIMEDLKELRDVEI